MRLFHLILSLVLATSLSSCIKYRYIKYFQEGTPEAKSPAEQKFARASFKYTLQPGDQIHLDLKAPDIKLLDAMGGAMQPQSLGAAIQPAGIFMISYTVSQDGYLYIPQIGKVKADGLTLEELRVALQAEINKYYKEASLTIRLMSFKVSVIGEVRTPGKILIYNEQATILEAIAAAGDMTEVADKTSIRLLRINSSGTKMYSLDLTDKKLLESEQYFLYPNDVIIVDPLKAKSQRINVQSLSILGVIASLINVVLLVISISNR